MTAWRPRLTIRVIAIGLIWRDRRLLAAEVLDDAGCVKGVRPLGGGVEFGETWRDALAREFREELGVKVAATGKPTVMENIFVHEGSTGHEVVFVSDVELPHDMLADGEDIVFREDNGVRGIARWFDLDELDVGGLRLYPSGLKQLLLEHRRDEP